MARTFPPKFRQDILYPAILNLDEVDIDGAVQIPAGSFIEGPIGRLKINAGGFLIYFND